MAKKVTHTTTDYDVTVQRREGRNVAVITAETVETLEDGRGYAGRRVINRDVMVVTLMSLPKLTDAIVSTLTYDMTADAQEKYDLANDAAKSVGLYPPGVREPVATFYTVAEARQVLNTNGPGWVIAHLPEEGEDFRNVIEVNQ